MGASSAFPCSAASVVSLAAQPGQDFSEVHIGAFDADAWNGIVFESKPYGQRVPFAIRVGSKTDGFLDGNRIFDAVSLVGPHAPDGSYSLVGWRHRPRAATITLSVAGVARGTDVPRSEFLEAATDRCEAVCDLKRVDLAVKLEWTDAGAVCDQPTGDRDFASRAARL